MSECRSVRVRPGKHEKGWPCVTVTLGNLRRVGCHDEVAWSDMPIGMAREVANEILQAAAEAEKRE